MKKIFFAVLIFSMMSACGSSSPSPATTYTIGGTISGLSGTIILQNNEVDDLSLSADGEFTFSTALANGIAYAVAILTQPNGQTCTVSNGTGTVSSANVTNVTVACANLHAYIAIFSDDKVAVLNINDNKLETSIDVGDGPYDIGITPDGEYVYAANSCADLDAGSISVIRTSDNTVIKTITDGVGKYPYAVTVSPSGEYVYVANQAEDSVSVIKTSDNTITNTFNVGDSPSALAVTPDGGYLYVANSASNSISVIPTSGGETINIEEINNPMGIAITPDGAYVYASNYQNKTVSVIRTSDKTVTATIDAGGSPFQSGLAITPDGKYVYVTDYDAHYVPVIQTSDNEVVAYAGGVNYPTDIAITSDGRFAYVTDWIGDSVTVIRTSDNTYVETIIDVGGHPAGIAIQP